MPCRDRAPTLAVLILTAAGAGAQTLTGSLSGTVRDELGAVVPGDYGRGHGKDRKPERG